MPYYGYSPYQMQQPQASFIRVQSEMQAREWNVAPGSSVTFIDDNAPYCYSKSMGMSQFEPPVFKKFRLVEETPSQNVQNAQESGSNVSAANLSDYITKAEFEPFKTIIENLKSEIEILKSKGEILNESTKSESAAES